jgi:hypothetical protein
MTKRSLESTGRLSRRSLLTCAAFAVGTVPIAGVMLSSRPAVAQAKMSKSAVAYQDKPKGNQDCSNCSLFQPPNACKNVAGDISPKGWCSIWAKK